MLTAINYLNAQWNRTIYWFHDASTRTGVRWLVSLSIWAYDRLSWRLSDEWQLICGVPVKEYTLRYELELARHQTAYFANYAYDLQCQILFASEETRAAEKTAKAETDAITKSKKRKKANK